MYNLLISRRSHLIDYEFVFVVVDRNQGAFDLVFLVRYLRLGFLFSHFDIIA